MTIATPTRRERILDAITERLVAISIANGFRTDLGKVIVVGEIPRFGPDDPTQALAVLPREDQIGETLSNIPIIWPIDIGILLSAAVSKPWKTVEAGIHDVKRAMELEDRGLGGLLTGGRNNVEGMLRGTTESYPRVSGTDAVGALITYAFKYVEAWGNPAA